MGEINIVHLHVRHKRYHTGIDRYLEMYSNGIKSEAYSDIRVHRIYIVDDRDIIFPRIRFTEEGTLHALIPMVYDNLLVSLDVFWKRRSMKIVVDMVKPYLQRLSNLVFQSHNLYLSVLAEELKNKLGGKIIMHLHCLPWKFTYNENEELYNKLHRLYEAGNFKEFNELEDSKIDYGVPDKIICLYDAAKRYLMNTKGVPEDKIHDLAANHCNTIPCMMPFVTAFFMPRQKDDRPLVRPKGSKNFAFIGQFAETPRDTIFTTEYSMRTGMEAVYDLLDIERAVPEVWGSAYDVRDMLKAAVHMRDGKPLTEMEMNPIEKLAVKEMLKKVKGTDIELVLKEYGAIPEED